MQDILIGIAVTAGAIVALVVLFAACFGYVMMPFWIAHEIIEHIEKPYRKKKAEDSDANPS